MSRKLKVNDYVVVTDDSKRYPDYTEMYQRMGLPKYSGSNWHNNYDNRAGQIIAIEPYNEFGVELLYGVGIGDVDIIINRDGLKRISKIKYVLLKKELNVKDF